MDLNEDRPQDDNGSDGLNDEGTRRFKEEMFDWTQNIAIILTIVVLLFVFVFRIIGVDGTSMEPTLHDKDWMITTNLFYKPDYGDIVVLKKKSFMEKPIVKRIIATEGQVIDMDVEKGIVYVDGVALDEPYIAEKTAQKYGFKFPAKVPKDCVFVMGDNRNRSRDSRDTSLGMVNKKYILGRLLFRIYPFDKIGTIKQDYKIPGK